MVSGSSTKTNITGESTKNIRSEEQAPNGNRVSTEALSTLGTTVGIFQHRIKRQLEEAQNRTAESRRVRDERQSSMLQAMNTIRRALLETCKINLGKRFEFDVTVTDWEGWPRLELRLVDLALPGFEGHRLIVRAHDRNDRGIIYFETGDDKQLGGLSLENQEELKKLPVVLKKAVREFLDRVSEYVLNPKCAEEQIEQPLEEPEEEAAPVLRDLAKEDVFEEVIEIPGNNLVRDEEDIKPLDVGLD